MTSVAQHVLALNMVSQAIPELTPEESLVVRAVAHFETKYGEAWPEGKGKGSFNMGAMMTGDKSAETCTGFVHQDSRPGKSGEPDVVQFKGCFKVYPSPQAGFRDLAARLFNTRHDPSKVIKSAANAGDIRSVAQGMFDSRYYTGTSKIPEENVNRYTTKLTESLDEITKATGERNPFLGEPPTLPGVA